MAFLKGQGSKPWQSQNALHQTSPVKKMDGAVLGRDENKNVYFFVFWESLNQPEGKDIFGFIPKTELLNHEAFNLVGWLVSVL